MTTDRLEELLREIPIEQSPHARERAVAEARAEIAGRAEAHRSRLPDRRWLLGFAAAALLVAVVLLTPPGRAARAWVGELVGIGEVGGSPTQEKRGFGEHGRASGAVVIDNGRAPDGSRYEWVAYRCEFESVKGVGLSLEWPGVKGGPGGADCGEETPERAPGSVFDSFGVGIVPSQFRGVENPDLVVSGSTDARVHRVRVVYTDRAGRKHRLPVDFARVEGKLRNLARKRKPIGTFVAFVPGAWAARDEIESRLDLRALMGTGELELGPVARRERRAARRAERACRSKRPHFSTLPDPKDQRALQRAFRPLFACLQKRTPRSPIEYVAYDERGRELERMREPLAALATTTAASVVRGTAGRERPGEKRWRRPRFPGAVGEPVILLRDRAPEGALYEVVLRRYEGGETCMSVWWPYVRGAEVGSCGRGLPPSAALSGRSREEVAAKPHGFLNDAAPATQHRTLSGFARSHVSRVRVVYRGREGGWHDAPVRLARVRGSLRARVKADAPFGFFVAFVPRATGPRPRIVVIAYGDDGKEAGRYRHRE